MDTDKTKVHWILKARASKLQRMKFTLHHCGSSCSFYVTPLSLWDCPSLRPIACTVLVMYEYPHSSEVQHRQLEWRNSYFHCNGSLDPEIPEKQVTHSLSKYLAPHPESLQWSQVKCSPALRVAGQ